jgi:putative hydrolase of the HAD superfamily
MKFKGIIFDVNGTLVDILTDEGLEEIYRGISHFLTYQGIFIRRWELRDEYFRIMQEQRRASDEIYPEYDVVEVWREFLRRRPETGRILPKDKLDALPLVLAEMYRGISRQRLTLYPEVKAILDECLLTYRMAALSDAQSAWAMPELRALGLTAYFNPIVVSGDLGYRKPDKRIFLTALSGLALDAGEVLFVGNDMYRDIYGAKQMGMATVFFSSNQGRKTAEGVEPDYIIYQFAELRQALAFLER